MRESNRPPMIPPDVDGHVALVAPPVRQIRARPGVLVVDDDRLVGAVVQLGLEREGFEVWLASSGREAINLYRQHGDCIAVVLLDVCMPGLDGLHTLDALRELTPDVHACFMTGNTGTYEPAELLQRGAASVICKPFPMRRLLDILEPFAQRMPAELVPADGVCQPAPRAIRPAQQLAVGLTPRAD